MGRCWVVDEWLLHDLKGDNGLERQQGACEFLDKILHQCDVIVCVEGSAWARKAYELMKYADPERRLLSKKLWGLLNDTKKAKRLRQEELKPLPPNLQQTLKPDDMYIVQAHIAVNADGIITTDEDLKNALEGKDIAVKLRDEFDL